jgi:hypothetical protein
MTPIMALGLNQQVDNPSHFVRNIMGPLKNLDNQSQIFSHRPGSNKKSYPPEEIAFELIRN